MFNKKNKIDIKAKNVDITAPETSETSEVSEVPRVPETPQPVNVKKNVKNNKLFKAAKIESLPKTVQQSIPFCAVYDNGIIETTPGEFTKTYAMKDVNFNSSNENAQYEIFEQYGKFLNSFDDKATVQITIYNKTIDKTTTLNNTKIMPRQDGLNVYRQDINNILFKRLLTGKNNITQEKYLTVKLIDNSSARAETRFSSLEEDIFQSSLSRIVSNPLKTLTSEERLALLHNIYNQNEAPVLSNIYDENGRPTFSLEQLRKMGGTPKNAIAPSGMRFEAGYFLLGEHTFGKTLYMTRNVPATMTSTFLSSLTALSINMLINITYEPADTAKAAKIISQRNMDLQTEVSKREDDANNRGFGFTLPTQLQTAIKNATELEEMAQENSTKFFYMTFMITVFGESLEELEDNTATIRGICESKMVDILPATNQHEFAFDSTLPLGINRMLNIDTFQTTESASILIPYTSQELCQNQSVFYGQNQSTHHTIMYDRTDRTKSSNSNGLMFGVPGSGKSTGAKWEMANVLLRDPKAQVFVIDPENEYGPLVKALHGTCVNLSPGSVTHINPLDLSIAEDNGGDPLKMQADFITSLIEIMADGVPLDQLTQSLISRCVNIIYKPYLARLREKGISEDLDHAPTLSDLYSELLRQKEPEAEILAKSIERYATGLADTFAYQTNIDVKNSRFVVYDTHNLNAQKELGLFVCLNDIWNRIIQNGKKGIHTWVYIDEFYLLLQSPFATKFLNEIWKRSRKYLGVPTGLMQNTEDLISSKETRNIIDNTDFIQIFKENDNDRNNLQELLNLSESQLGYITNSSSGTGLLCAGDVIIPFDNRVPTTSKIYQLINTSGNKN